MIIIYKQYNLKITCVNTLKLKYFILIEKTKYFISNEKINIYQNKINNSNGTRRDTLKSQIGNIKYPTK